MAMQLTAQRRNQARAARPQATSSIDPQEVSRMAYELYEQRGREDGHDLEDWLKAERIVRQRDNGRKVLHAS